MGMLECPVSLPDTSGLPEFYVTEVIAEGATGSNVRLVCGVRRGRGVYWLYSVVMPAERLLAAARVCELAAMESFHEDHAPAH